MYHKNQNIFKRLIAGGTISSLFKKEEKYEDIQ